MREQLADLEAKLRDLQKQIVITNTENEQIRRLLEAEKELREERDVEEANALLLVADDLKHSNNALEEEKKKAKRQREAAEGATVGLDRIITD